MSNFLGTGTIFYGKKNIGRDGSYITTKWLTILYLPVYPLGSYRLWPNDQSFSYDINRKGIKLTLNLIQVTQGYSCLFSMLLLVIVLRHGILAFAQDIIDHFLH